MVAELVGEDLFGDSMGGVGVAGDESRSSESVGGVVEAVAVVAFDPGEFDVAVVHGDPDAAGEVGSGFGGGGAGFADPGQGRSGVGEDVEGAGGKA